MLDIGWSEMAVIALVALMVIGPKELPHALRAAAKWVRKARNLAREFQSGIDDMVREAELEDARKAIGNTRSFDLEKTLEDTVDPTGTVRDAAGDLESAARSSEPGAPVPAASGNEGGSAAEPAEAPAEDAAKGATVVQHPVNVAPAHSLTPPDESGESSAPVATAGDDGTQKRA